MAENSKIEWTTHTFNPLENGGKLVEGFPCYCVTPEGHVYTRFQRVGKRPRVIGAVWAEKAPDTTTKGHKRVELYGIGAGGAKRKIMVHTLVLEAFVGPCPEGMEGCHEDGNPANNNVRNLRWDTPRGNWQDRKRHGRGCEGEKNPGGGKLNVAKIKQIRAMRRSGCTLKLIAEHYGISVAMVSKVVHNKAWSHIDG